MRVIIEGTNREIRELCSDFYDLTQTTLKMFGKEYRLIPLEVTLSDGDSSLFSSRMVLQEVVAFKTTQEIKAEEAVKAAEESLKKAKEALEAVKK